MAYITCRNLSLGYDGRAIVTDLNFVVNKGDYLCIVGENGAGKSTLVKTLLHLTPAFGGEIVMGDGLGANEIGYLPQQTVVQRDFPATVWEIVLSGTLPHMGNRPFYTKKERDMAKDKLTELGMWELRKQPYRHLSGGQQQRVLLARALCATSRIILLDEPVTGLDPKVTLEFYQIVKQLNVDGVTVIMVSHDVQALEYASHVLHITREESYFGTKSDYMKQPIAEHLIKNADDKSGEV